MAQTAKKRKLIVLGVVAVLVIAAVTYVAIVMFPGSQTPPPQDTFVPKLEANLQVVDNRTNSHNPYLQVKGTIENVGNGTAKSVTLHVYALQSGNATAIDTSKLLPDIAAGQTQTVNLTFSYTGEALTAYSQPTLDWTN
ncbi:MAG: hypothetical protein NWE96_11310 [Candidatus Bathyarchaeota archaeon]|nr:hypothetical protein [Candidatus Bathyarchaeota archaeon]